MGYKKITYQMLVDANACGVQRGVFKRRFGDGVVPTRALAIKYAQTLRVMWMSRCLLSSDGYRLFAAKRANIWEVHHDRIWRAPINIRRASANQARREVALAWLDQWRTHPRKFRK